MSNRTGFLTGQPPAALRLWRHRQLVASLASRNLKVKYKRSVLGFVWTLVNPLVTLAILVAIFTHVVRVPIEHYWAFLLSGYFVWNYLGQALTSATYVLSEHGQLSRAVAFPKEAPILAAALSRLVEFSIEMALVLLALAIFHHGFVPLSFLVIPWLIVVQVVMALGLGFPIATLAAFYHDVEHALPIIVTTLFYLSPVFYSAHLVPEGVRSLYMLNPIAGLLTLYQTTIYLGQAPDPGTLIAVTAATAALLIIGYGIFHRFEPLVAEVV